MLASLALTSVMGTRDYAGMQEFQLQAACRSQGLKWKGCTKEEMIQKLLARGTASESPVRSAMAPPSPRRAAPARRNAQPYTYEQVVAMDSDELTAVCQQHGMSAEGGKTKRLVRILKKFKLQDQAMFGFGGQLRSAHAGLNDKPKSGKSRQQIEAMLKRCGKKTNPGGRWTN